MKLSKDEIVALLLRALPYPHQVTHIDTQSEEFAIRFTWRHSNFRVSDGLSVKLAKDGFLGGGMITIVMEELLKTQQRMEEIVNE